MPSSVLFTADPLPLPICCHFTDFKSFKLAHLALGKKIIIVKNATAYTWDWYCHLVVDRASFELTFELQI